MKRENAQFKRIKELEACLADNPTQADLDAANFVINSQKQEIKRLKTELMMVIQKDGKAWLDLFDDRAYWRELCGKMANAADYLINHSDGPGDYLNAEQSLRDILSFWDAAQEKKP